MADVLKRGSFYFKGKTYAYKCECDDGTTQYSDTNNPSPCENCSGEGISNQGGATSLSGFRNMSGGSFSLDLGLLWCIKNSSRSNVWMCRS